VNGASELISTTAVGRPVGCYRASRPEAVSSDSIATLTRFPRLRSALVSLMQLPNLLLHIPRLSHVTWLPDLALLLPHLHPLLL